MLPCLRVLVVILWVFALPSAPANADERRVALVIGNGSYARADALPNPPRDARAMSAALRGVGFEVVEGIDLSLADMLQALNRFAEALDGAGTAVVYYAGHGIGIDGVNYLVPIDAELASRSQLALQTVSADLLLDMLGAEDRVSIVMLDACRNNPFTRSFKALGRGEASQGLAEMKAKTGAYIAFATAPGDQALDGTGENSPFATALLSRLSTPGLEINELMTEVRKDVWDRTEKDQLPWASSALLGRFYFVPPAVASPAPAPAVVAALKVEPDAVTQRTSPDGSAEPMTDQESMLLRAENATLQTRDARRRVQSGLRTLGLLVGRADGVFGAATRAAIRDLQTMADLETTGYVDDATRRSLLRQLSVREPKAIPLPSATLAPSAVRIEEDVSLQPPKVSFSPGTMGECIASGGASWAGTRLLTFAQCRKLAGTFRPL